MTEHSDKEALFWEMIGDRIHCRLCPQKCVLQEGQTGVCRIRTRRDGRLIADMYGRVSSASIDPIEKKPLYHFHPGRSILSLGTVGCNLACLFCQNWQISQEVAPTQELLPADAVRLAQSSPENLGIAYTYNEPLVWYEYLLDTSRLVREAGMKNVVVTNGEIEEAPLRELLPTIDAMNIDLKSMDRGFYKRVCKGPLDPVLRTIRIAFEAGCHLEITNLLIPTLNDSEEQIRALVDWVAALSAEIPLHFSRYHPAYKMALPPTPLESLTRAYEIAREKLRYVYLGNLLDEATAATYCPTCRRPVIERWGMGISRMALEGTRCRFCGGEVKVVV